MHQTLCADIHFITGGACMCGVCAGQLLEKIHAGWAVHVPLIS